MRYLCGIKHVQLRGCCLLEVGSGLLPLLTGKLFLTLSCNLIFLSYLVVGGAWGYVTVLIQLLFGWWPTLPSLEQTEVSLSKQEGETEEGPSTWTCHLPQFTLCFPVALHLERRKAFPPTQAVSEGSSERGTDAQNGEAAPNARPSVHAVGTGEGTHIQQCRMTWWQGAAYLKEGKAPIKASRKLSWVWDCWVWPCKYSYFWFCSLICGPSLIIRTFWKQTRAPSFPALYLASPAPVNSSQLAWALVPAAAWHIFPVSSTLLSLTFIIPWAKLLCALIMSDSPLGKRGKVDFFFFLHLPHLCRKVRLWKEIKCQGETEILGVFGRGSALDMSRWSFKERLTTQ